MAASPVDVISQNACYVGIDLSDENNISKLEIQDATTNRYSSISSLQKKVIQAGTSAKYGQTKCVVADPYNWDPEQTQTFISIQVSGFAPSTNTGSSQYYVVNDDCEYGLVELL